MKNDIINKLLKIAKIQQAALKKLADLDPPATEEEMKDVERLMTHKDPDAKELFHGDYSGSGVIRSNYGLENATVYYCEDYEDNSIALIEFDDIVFIISYYDDGIMGTEIITLKYNQDAPKYNNLTLEDHIGFDTTIQDIKAVGKEINKNELKNIINELRHEAETSRKMSALYNDLNKMIKKANWKREHIDVDSIPDDSDEINPNSHLHNTSETTSKIYKDPKVIAIHKQDLKRLYKERMKLENIKRHKEDTLQLFKDLPKKVRETQTECTDEDIQKEEERLYQIKVKLHFLDQQIEESEKFIRSKPYYNQDDYELNPSLKKEIDDDFEMERQVQEKAKKLKDDKMAALHSDLDKIKVS